MALTVVGVSHRTAPLPVRERIVVSATETRRTLGDLLADSRAR